MLQRERIVFLLKTIINDWQSESVNEVNSENL